MKPQFKLFFILLLAQLPFISCQENDSDINVQATVVAKAGPDQSVTLPQDSSLLDGSQSSVTNGRIINYNWSKIAGPPSFHITDAAAAQTQVSNLIEGEYQFKLNVTAEGGISSTDTMVLVVVDTVHNTSAHWTLLENIPDSEPFVDPDPWFNGSNFLMGIGNQVFAVSNRGGVWRLSGYNNWDKRGNFPEKMQMPPVVFSLRDKGYCVGGSRLWQYDAGVNKWERKSDVPNSILNVQAALVIQNKVYLVGATGHVMSYDPATDTYSPQADYPGTEAAAGFVVNGKGICIEADGISWEYRPATDSWQQKASLPQTISSMRGFSLNNTGYVMGDLNHAAYNFNQPIKVWRYDSAADQWLEFEENYPGNGVYDINAVSMEGRAVIGLGYHNGDFPSTDIWRFD